MHGKELDRVVSGDFFSNICKLNIRSWDSSSLTERSFTRNQSNTLDRNLRDSSYKEWRPDESIAMVISSANIVVFAISTYSGKSLIGHYDKVVPRVDLRVTPISISFKLKYMSFTCWFSFKKKLINLPAVSVNPYFLSIYSLLWVTQSKALPIRQTTSGSIFLSSKYSIAELAKSTIATVVFLNFLNPNWLIFIIFEESLDLP